MSDQKKQMILAALHKFASQRSGLEFGNYGDVAAYQSEARSITKDLTEARRLLRAVELRDSITGDALEAACDNAFSGRLKLIQVTRDAQFVDSYDIDYTTGQYFPTEYRRAVCAVAASALWTWLRDTSMPSDERLTELKQSPGDYLRAYFKREFGRGMASRWFN